MIRYLSLAGRIAVRTCDGTVDERALPGRQPRLAFSLLVCERHRPVPREELADNLWPERRPETWPSALRSVVSRVRDFVSVAGLGPRDLILADAGTYRLRPLIDVEVTSSAPPNNSTRRRPRSRPVTPFAPRTRPAGPGACSPSHSCRPSRAHGSS